MSNELATKLGARCNGEGFLFVDDRLRTKVEGLYAIGDVTMELHQISVATGQAVGLYSRARYRKSRASPGSRYAVDKSGLATPGHRVVRLSFPKLEEQLRHQSQPR